MSSPSNESASAGEDRPWTTRYEGVPGFVWLQLSSQLIRATHRLRQRIADVAAPHGLGDNEVLLLLRCAAASRQGIAQVELASELAISTAHVSQIVQRLRGRGWLAGRRGTADRRLMLWRLAPAGEELLHGLISDLTPAFSELAARFGSLQQARAVLLLRQLDDLDEAIKHHEHHARQSDTEQTASGQQGRGREAA